MQRVAPLVAEDDVVALKTGDQFFPVTLVDPKRAPIEGACYSILNVRNLVPAMDADLSKGERLGPIGQHHKPIFEFARGINFHMVLRREVAGSLHSGREQLRPESGLFFSDALETG